MKILFTADIHIKLGQKNIPVDWSKHRYRELFQRICDLAAKEQVDILVLGGDTFDRIPNMEELELFFDFMFKIRCNTIIYSGNHEAIKKDTTFLTYLKDIVYNISCSTGEHRIHIVDKFTSRDNLDFLPYNCLKTFDFTTYDPSDRILFTHVRGDIPPHVKAEIPLDLLSGWKRVFAGDLHSHSNSQRNIVYPGSPVTTSFHREHVKTGLILIDSNTAEYSWIDLELPQLIRKTIKAGEPTPETHYDHTVYEVEGSMLELGALEASALVDKKITKRNTDTSLLLSDNMSIQDELVEYLSYILELSEEEITSIVTEYACHVSGE